MKIAVNVCIILTLNNRKSPPCHMPPMIVSFFGIEWLVGFSV